MSRSGYTDDCDDDLALGRWRAQVASATRGKRGQRFFLDLVTALDAIPNKCLVPNELETADGVCALGALGRLRGVALPKLDHEDGEDPERLAAVFDVARQLTAEVMYMNDEDCQGETPHARWLSVRAWAVKQLLPETLLSKEGGKTNV